MPPSASTPRVPRSGLSWWLIHALLGLFAVMVLLPVMRTGQWAESHEHARYSLLFDCFRDVVLRGHLYPRWLPDLYGGFGYPEFCFYQPGFFFAALPFSLLSGKPHTVLYLTVWAVLTLGAAGAYRLSTEIARRLQRDSKTWASTGVFGAALFLLTPYLWVDLYVRGDLSEAMGLCLSPWPLALLLQIADRVERGTPSLGRVFLAGAGLAAVVFAHPIVSMFVLPTFGIVALFLGYGLPTWRFHARAALALCLGLLLSLVYWYPLATLRSEVSMERATKGIFEAVQHVVYPQQFFSRKWGFGLSGWGTSDDMSFALGLVHFLLATAGLYFGRKQRVIRGAYLAYLGLLVAMTPVSTFLWRDIGLFKLVQFPWRLLSATAALQILCMAGLAACAGKGRRYALSLIGMLLVALAFYHDQFRILQPLDVDALVDAQRAFDVRSSRLTYGIVNEFLPKTAPEVSRLAPRGKWTPILESRPSADITPLSGDDEFTIHRSIRARVATKLTINQLYFPGWRVLVDGQLVSDDALRRTLDAEGRMTASLAAGHHVLEATYDGPPGWRTRVTLVILVLLLFALFWWRERRAGLLDKTPAQG